MTARQMYARKEYILLGFGCVGYQYRNFDIIIDDLGNGDVFYIDSRTIPDVIKGYFDYYPSFKTQKQIEKYIDKEIKRCVKEVIQDLKRLEQEVKNN